MGLESLEEVDAAGLPVGTTPVSITCASSDVTYRLAPGEARQTAAALEMAAAFVEGVQLP